MAYQPKDFYFKKAKEKDFVARSVFKLEEMDRRWKIFRAGQKILDLGAAPGSWSQYASKVIGPQGFILGIDIKPIQIQLKNAEFRVADISATDFQGMEFDVVMSDMAPSTTGIKSADQAKSLELCELALSTAQKYLKPKGHFICKIFHSGEFDQFRKNMRPLFTKVEVIKPESTRKASKEIFLVGLHRNRL
jgi:23S rRNA (uridine2552-2'-O)-methyltransferase